MLPGCSPRSRLRSTRQSMNTQTNRPTDSSTCQIRARSRYSKPWSPNQFEAAPSSTPWMPEERADQRAEDDDRERAEQREGELALVLGLAPGDHRREEDARRPRTTSRPRTARAGRARCASGCTGRPARGRSRRSRRSRRGSAGRRRRRASGSGTARPSRRRTTRTRAAPASARRRPGARNDSVACSRPCQPRKPPAAEDAEQDPDAAEQRDQREHAPDDHVGGRPVVDARLGRPVVGVGVVVARALRRRRPTPSSRRTRSAGAARCDR